MPYDDTMDTTNGISQLSNMNAGPPTGDSNSAGPPGSTPGASPGGSAAPGGPGPDTPQEQQALKLLMQGALMMRRATEVEPSIRYIIDDLLQKAYLQVTKHYGMEQEGKLALQQAQLRANRNRASAVTGPPKPQTGGLGA